MKRQGSTLFPRRCTQPGVVKQPEAEQRMPWAKGSPYLTVHVTTTAMLDSLKVEHCENRYRLALLIFWLSFIPLSSQHGCPASAEVLTTQMSSSLPEPPPPSSSRALIWTRSPSPEVDPSAYSSRGRGQWQPILHASNQVVLYNPQSHALTITTAPDGPAIFVPAQRRPAITGRATGAQHCPYCKQILPGVFHSEHGFSHSADIDEVDEQGTWEPFIQNSEEDQEFESLSTDPAYHSRASNYFRLLEIANDVSSQGSTSRRSSVSPSLRESMPDDNRNSDSHARSRRRDHGDGERRQEEYRSEKGAFPAERMAEGYFGTFFQEECKLGMGASGSVFLCQVSLYLLSDHVFNHDFLARS